MTAERSGPVAEDQAGDGVGGVLLDQWQHVGVIVERDLDVGVAEAFADHLGGDAGGQTGTPSRTSGGGSAGGCEGGRRARWASNWRLKVSGRRSVPSSRVKTRPVSVHAGPAAMRSSSEVPALARLRKCPFTETEG